MCSCFLNTVAHYGIHHANNNDDHGNKLLTKIKSNNSNNNYSDMLCDNIHTHNHIQLQISSTNKQIKAIIANSINSAERSRAHTNIAIIFHY